MIQKLIFYFDFAMYSFYDCKLRKIFFVVEFINNKIKIVENALIDFYLSADLECHYFRIIILSKNNIKFLVLEKTKINSLY